jgi:hypothetical protein
MTISTDLAAIELTSSARQAFRAAGARADCALVLIELQVNELKRLCEEFGAILPAVGDMDAAAGSYMASIVSKL